MKTREQIKQLFLRGYDEAATLELTKLMAHEAREAWLDQQRDAYEAAHTIVVGTDEDGYPIEALSEDRPKFEEWLPEAPDHSPTDDEIEAELATYWRERRQARYGDWRQQIDELYHDQTAWYERIQAIKKEIPKV